VNNYNKNNKNNKNKTTNTNITKMKSSQKLISNENKRNHSSSSNSKPLPPKILQHVGKKLFLIQNRFGLLKPTDIPDETIVEETQSIADPVFISPEPPPPIFIRDLSDFRDMCTILLIKPIGVNKFICKSTVDHLKVQTSIPEAYRTLVHYLKN